MSKRLKAQITCPNCNHQFDFTLYRSIWGEYPENRDLVMSDNINVAQCSACQVSTKLAYPFLYTNAPRHFAVWWEPYHDSQIDEDAAGYAKMLGAGNYLASAPRIKDWSEFKQAILMFEQGLIVGQKPVMSKEMEGQMEGFVKHLKQQNAKKSNSGCLGVGVLLAIILGLVVYTIAFLF